MHHVSFLPREKETADKVEQLRIVLKKLPAENYSNLRYVNH
jgi:hypothetical protein